MSLSINIFEVSAIEFNKFSIGRTEQHKLQYPQSVLAKEFRIYILLHGNLIPLDERMGDHLFIWIFLITQLENLRKMAAASQLM